jgi:hypothetical protein
MKKEFDCLKMKNDAQRKIYEETKGLTVGEELKYWQRKSRTLRPPRTVPKSQKKTGVNTFR